jgi:hypothetical protein
MVATKDLTFMEQERAALKSKIYPEKRTTFRPESIIYNS